MSSTVVIRTPQNVSIEYELASPLERILGIIVDTIVQAGLTYLFILLFEFIKDTFFVDNYYFFNNYQWIIFVFYLPILFYGFLMELFNDGKTVGKLLCHTKVVKQDGSQPALGDYLMRSILLMIDHGFFLIGLFVMIFNKKNLRLGDIAAGTVVIRTRYKASFEDTIFRDIIDEKYQVRFPQVAKLSDRDINVALNVISQKERSDYYERLAKLSKRIKDVLNIESDQENERFIRTVLNDYNYLTGKDGDE